MTGSSKTYKLGDTPSRSDTMGCAMLLGGFVAIILVLAAVGAVWGALFGEDDSTDRSAVIDPPSSTINRRLERSTWTEGPWPFTVDEVTLVCLEGGTYDGAAIAANGTLYALNGTARQIDPLLEWSDSIRVPGTGGVGMASIEGVRAQALRLC